MNTKSMTLVESLRVNHSILVYQADSAVAVKLLDGSEEGDFIDEQGTITESQNVGTYYIPFKNGTCTVGSAAEVAAIVRRLPMPVERRDYARSRGQVAKFFEITPDLFPETDEHLAALLSASSVDYNVRLQPWYPLMQQAMEKAAAQDLFV